MNELTEEEKTDLLGYFFACLICSVLLITVLIIREAVSQPQPEPYRVCRIVGHLEVPCPEERNHD